MSNTPNPRRKVKPTFPRTRPQLAYEIYRDEAGNVHTPRGYVAKDIYQKAQELRPDLFPCWNLIPIRRRAEQIEKEGGAGGGECSS